MKQRRIAPTLALLAGVSGIGALACYGFDPLMSISSGLWQSALAPRMARADESPADAVAPRISNPFATSSVEEPAQDAPLAIADMAPPGPLPAMRGADQSSDTPSLEPIRPRRTNPRLPEDVFDDHPAPRQASAVKAAARPTAVKPKDRYADRKFVVPVSHNDPIPQAASAANAYVPQARADATYAEPSGAGSYGVRREPQRAVALDAVPTADARPTCRGGVTLEWITPDAATVGQEVSCQLLVRNTSDALAGDVVVEAELPADVELGSMEPRAHVDGRMIVWQFGDLTPGATTSARINFMPRHEGAMTPRAAVTCTHHAAVAIQVVESRLTLALEGPEEAIVGQAGGYLFRVTNQGSGPAVGVAVDVALDEGLEAAGGKPRYNIGTIGPGESRHVQVTIAGTRQGDFSVRGQVVAGDAVKDAATRAVRIVKPALTMEMEGPKLRFVDRKATYVVKVQNPGPVAIDNVQVLENIPEGLRFVEASSGGSYDRNARQVAWFVGRLEANETAEVGVQLIATDVGDHRLNAAATADFGVLGEAEAVTQVKGAPRVVIDVTEDDDPVEVDGETVYHIRLSNIGSMPARRVQCAAEAPREMQILDANGPSAGAIKGQQVIFPPVASLEAGQSVDYDVHVKCGKAGAVRFKAFFRSEDTPTPVLEEEATRIYAD